MHDRRNSASCVVSLIRAHASLLCCCLCCCLWCQAHRRHSHHRTQSFSPRPQPPRKTLAASKPSQHPHPLQASSVIINTSKHVGARGSTSHSRVPRQTPRAARQAWVHKSRGPQTCSGAHVLRPRYVVVWIVRACVCDLLCGKKEEAGLVCVGYMTP
jgi:hypothetical protein